MNSKATPPKATMLAEDLRRRQRRHRRATPLWTLASLLFHSTTFVALVMFTPIRELVIPEPQAAQAPNLSAERLEQLSQTIEDIHRSDLMAYVQELELTRSELDAVREEMLENYDEFAAQQAETVAETLEAFINEAARLQQDAMTQQDAAEKDLTEAQPLVQQAVNHQVLAKDTLEKALNRAELTGMAKTAEAMTEVVMQQEDANVKQVEAQRKIAEMNASSAAAQRVVESVAAATTELAEAVARHEAAAAMEATAKTEKDAADTEVAEVAESLAEAEKKVQESDEARKQAQQELSEARKAKEAEAIAKAEEQTKAASEALSQARAEAKAMAEAKKSAEAEKRKTDKAAQDAAKAAASAKTAQERAEAELAKRNDQVEPTSQRAKETAVVAEEEQKLAAEEQKKAAAKLLEAARVAVTETAAPEPAAQPATMAQLPPEVRRMDVVELYDLARALEAKVTETYRDVRAAEVAMLRAVPLEQAKALTDVALPVRPELNAAVLREAARTSDAFEKRKEETATAVRETQGMVEASRSLLEIARSLAQDGTAFSAEGIAAMVAQQNALSAAAAENEAVQAKDLSALMNPAAPSPAEAAGGAEQEPPKVPPEKLADADPDTDVHVDRSKDHPILTARTPNVNPGSIVGNNNVATSWMYVDAWYILGPFPNPQRANIDRKFPPETVLDLDASYVGKDDRIIRWVYHKSPRIMIMPDNAEPYGIWYAYTELHFPEACDLWIAVGSDDKSKIWINDTLVWESVPWHKSWRMNEGYRRVHFRQGRNRVLYRVENGQHGMGWSLAVHLGGE